MALSRRLQMLAAAILIGLACGGAIPNPPYPPSRVITGIDWAPRASQAAKGSDLWPITWANDDLLYTSFGDGWGFDDSPGCKRRTIKLSSGWATLEGTPDSYRGCNIASNTEAIGDGKSGKKAHGMLSVDGALYAAMSNADGDGRQCEIWKSRDRGVHWVAAEWKFAELGVCALLNFGRDYAGARDDYVYLYSPDTDSAYLEADATVLARVPRSEIMLRSAWRFFAGLRGGEPIWSVEIAERAPVFEFPGGCNRLAVVYVPALDRYLMTMRARAYVDPSHPNHFSIYDAPEPWGPWTTVYYAESPLPGMSPMNTRSGGWGESQHIPSKWIDADGAGFWLVYSGDDSFRLRRATLELAPRIPPTPAGDAERDRDSDAPNGRRSAAGAAE